MAAINIHTFVIMRYIIISLCAMLFLTSCVNDMNQIMGMSEYDKLPAVTSYDFQMMYSDSGLVKARLTAPQRNVYEGDAPYMEMPKGLTVIFYDAAHKPETTINAKYGIRKEKEGTMEVRNNVVVINNKGEQLNTEQLIWDEQTEKLRSDVFVKITTPEQIIFGDGLEADQNFSSYRIKKIKGTIKLKDNPVE